LTSNEDGKYQIVFKYTKEQQKCLEKEGFLKKIEDPSKKESEDCDDDLDTAKDDGFVFEGQEVIVEEELLVNELFIDKI